MAEKKTIYTNTATTMDEQWLKSNTDCVYFLASPLTCNKGIECEFRHSDFARLNPRECRYWFSGNCLNPDCAFRHPPLDGPIGSLELAPVNKSNAPCYFFFNGFCNKGQSCLFLHELDNANRDSTKTVHTINMELIDKELPVGGDLSCGEPIVTLANPSAIIDKPATDRNMAMGNDISSDTPISTYASPLENYPDIVLSEKNNPSTLRDVSRHFSHQQSLAPLFTEDNISKLDFPLASRELTKKTSYASQSSECQVGKGTEHEECESSPSFDVQVNEHDADSFPSKFDKVSGCYPYENVDLNLLYPGESIMYENEEYQSYGHFDIENPSICANKRPSHVRNRELDFLHSQRWTSLRSRRASGNEDLREHLKKRRLVNDNDQDCFSSSRFRSSQNEEMHRNPLLKHSRGRLTSQVVSAGVGSHIKRQSFKKSSTQQRIPWLSRRSGPGQHFRGRKSGRKQALNSRKSKPFDEFCDRRETTGGAGDEEFRGPKSLDEILMEKRMLREMAKEDVAGLRRSQISFRRQGSSGLVWEDKKHLSGELHKTIVIPKKDEITVKWTPDSEAHKGYRASVVDAGAIDPPSPKVSGCGLCGGIFGKSGFDNKNSKTHSSFK